MTPNRILEQEDKRSQENISEHSPSWWAHVLTLLSSPLVERSPVAKTISDGLIPGSIELNRSLLMASPLDLHGNPFSPASGAVQQNDSTSMPSPLLSRLVQSVTSPENNISNDILRNWSPFIGGGMVTEVSQYDISDQPLTAESLSFSATNARYNQAMEAAETHFIQSNEKTASGDSDSELSYTESDTSSEQSRSGDTLSHNSDDDSGIFVNLEHTGNKDKARRDTLSTTSNESSDSDNDKENQTRKSGRKTSAPNPYSPDYFKNSNISRKRKAISDNDEKEINQFAKNFRL